MAAQMKALLFACWPLLSLARSSTLLLPLPLYSSANTRTQRLQASNSGLETGQTRKALSLQGQAGSVEASTLTDGTDQVLSIPGVKLVNDGLLRQQCKPSR